MKASDLRIGNFIYWNIPEKKNVIHTVIGIKNDKPMTVPISLGNSIEDYQPILLTPEILVMAGFDEWSEGNWKTRSSLNKQGWSKEFNYYQPYYNLSTYCGNVTIKYLHQLQNIYFSLTGEELEIKQLITPHTGQSNAV